MAEAHDGEGQMERAWTKARDQLDFVLKKSMDLLLAFEEPPPLVLLAVQAAVAAAGLLPGLGEELTWAQLKPLLSEPGKFLQRLASFSPDGRERVVATLQPFFERPDFRPVCLEPVSRAAAHLCSWCLALFVLCGGPPPLPAPRPVAASRPKQAPLPAPRPVAASRPKQAGAPPEQAGAPQKQGALAQWLQSETPQGQAEAAPAGGGLRVLALSGEEVARLLWARPEWTRRKLCVELRGAWQPNAGCIFRFQHGAELVKGLTTLGELGLDPSCAEGAEITVVTSPVPEEALRTMEEAEKLMKLVKEADVKEVRCMKMPPPLAVTALQAVYAVLHPEERQPQQVSWEKLKTMMAGPNFLRSLREFDRDTSHESVALSLQPFMDMESFEVVYVKRCSSACASMCQWCRALHAYSCACLA